MQDLICFHSSAGGAPAMPSTRHRLGIPYLEIGTVERIGLEKWRGQGGQRRRRRLEEEGQAGVEERQEEEPTIVSRQIEEDPKNFSGRV